MWEKYISLDKEQYPANKCLSLGFGTFSWCCCTLLQHLGYSIFHRVGFPLNRFESSKSGINLPTFCVFSSSPLNRSSNLHLNGSLIPDHSELQQGKSTSTRMVFVFHNNGSFVTMFVQKVLHTLADLRQMEGYFWRENFIESLRFASFYILGDFAHSQKASEGWYLEWSLVTIVLPVASITGSHERHWQMELAGYITSSSSCRMQSPTMSGKLKARNVPVQLGGRMFSTCNTLPKTNSEFTPENRWLEVGRCDFLFGMAYVQRRNVSFREGTVHFFLVERCWTYTSLANLQFSWDQKLPQNPQVAKLGLGLGCRQEEFAFEWWATFIDCVLWASIFLCFLFVSGVRGFLIFCNVSFLVQCTWLKWLRL